MEKKRDRFFVTYDRSSIHDVLSEISRSHNRKSAIKKAWISLPRLDLTKLIKRPFSRRSSLLEFLFFLL
jgi:hypothetical protein